MADKSALEDAKKGKNDEFYTQYEDIQKEMNAYLEFNPNVFKGKTVLLPCDDPEWSNFTKFFAQNFEMLGLKKLISTSYASDSKKAVYNFNEEYHKFTIFDVTDFERTDVKFDRAKTHTKGKIFVLERDNDKSGHIDINDLEWDYLDGDGDFRSEEITKLRNEADFIITNPPFSLFREFIAWIMEGDVMFSIIGNQNAISYKEVFPLIKNTKIWLGCSIHSGDREFRVPNSYPLTASGHRIDDYGNKYVRVKGVRWFTNIEHGRRHQPMSLMSMDDNLKFSKHKEIKGGKYFAYDNYDAIDVPYSDAIPSDYYDVMGVPITFMDKYCPEQFEILGLAMGPTWDEINDIKTKKVYKNALQHSVDSEKVSSGGKINTGPAIKFHKVISGKYYTADNEKGVLVRTYARILIRRINNGK